MESSIALKQERLTIGAQILEARNVGDFDLEETLERRQIRLPKLIIATRDAEDAATLAKLEAEAETLRPLEAAADIRLKEARAQFDYWKNEIEAAQKDWERLLCQSRIIDIRRHHTGRVLETRQALWAAKNSGKPIRVPESFYNGLSVADLKQLNDEIG